MYEAGSVRLKCHVHALICRRVIIFFFWIEPFSLQYENAVVSLWREQRERYQRVRRKPDSNDRASNRTIDFQIRVARRRLQVSRFAGQFDGDEINLS